MIDSEDIYYPGSKKKIPDRSTPDIVPEKDWLTCKSRTLNVKGIPTEFYEIGALAAALNRHPGTIRRWITEKTFPEASYRTKAYGKTEKRRRLWTRPQIEGIIQLAQKHGLMNQKLLYTKGIPVAFTEEANKLMKEVK